MKVDVRTILRQIMAVYNVEVTEIAYPYNQVIENEYLEDEDIRIVRTKRFDIEPMYPEDACVQMELLGHNFFVFCNAETNEVNVVYKRKGNTYGLMEPEA